MPDDICSSSDSDYCPGEKPPADECGSFGEFKLDKCNSGISEADECWPYVSGSDQCGTGLPKDDYCPGNRPSIDGETTGSDVCFTGRLPDDECEASGSDAAGDQCPGGSIVEDTCSPEGSGKENGDECSDGDYWSEDDCKNDDPDTEAVLAAFREHYKNHDRDATRPYPGITEMLSSLDMPMGIVSNKPDAAVKRLCAEFFPGIYARGEVEGVARKPAPDGLFAAMQDLGIDRCIYIGDSDVDVATAKNAGIDCLCVTWGFRSQQQLEAAGGKHFCHQVSQLPEKIKELLYGK